MIKGINSSSRYINVQGGQPSNTYINSYGGSGVGVGNLRFSPTSNQFEVFDGNNWQTIGMSYATIELTPDTESLLEWAREQRNKQWAYESMAKDHPAIRNALDAIKRAEEHLDLVYKLSKDHDPKNEGVTTSP